MTLPLPDDDIVVRGGDPFPVALFALDSEGLFSFWNREFLALLGLSDSRLPRVGMENLLRTSCPFLEAPKANSVFEAQWKKQDGTPIAVEIRLSSAPEGDSHALLGSAREISRRRETESEVRRLASQNELLLRANEILALETDEDRLLQKLLDLLERRLSPSLLRLLKPREKEGFLSVLPSSLSGEEPALRLFFRSWQKTEIPFRLRSSHAARRFPSAWPPTAPPRGKRPFSEEGSAISWGFPS